jgi:hypothetical protein
MRPLLVGATHPSRLEIAPCSVDLPLFRQVCGSSGPETKIRRPQKQRSALQLDNPGKWTSSTKAEYDDEDEDARRSSVVVLSIK